jgi:alpha-galactosidase
VGLPTFEIDGEEVDAQVIAVSEGATRTLGNGCTEYSLDVQIGKGCTLACVFRIAPDNPVLRFQYALKADPACRLTKSGRNDSLTYLRYDASTLPQLVEIRLSEFQEGCHSYVLREEPVAERAMGRLPGVMGPLLTASDGTSTALIAHEHGSTVPDAYLRYDISADRNVTLRALKGNYVSNRVVSAEQPFQTVWMHFAAGDGSPDDLAPAYREFVLRYMTENAASRAPYIFYNTWNYQERKKHWYKTPYLDKMHQERMLAEIDVAHRMGIDVFVLDTGWYSRTGDWRVNRERFPDGLKTIRDKLAGYGMKLGLWFDNAAAVSSEVLAKHQDCVMSQGGDRGDPQTSQVNAVASLVLGHNGIWGDLLRVSPEGVDRIGGLLAAYKQVRDDITAAPSVRTGEVGGSPEIHEKISPKTARGAVVIFANAQGTYEYVTSHPASSVLAKTGGIAVESIEGGKALVRAHFGAGQSAQIVFFK